MKNGSEKYPQLSMVAASALGDDRNLHDNGSDRRYWYSIGDGFRLLQATRQNRLNYTREDGSPYVIKALGEDHVATRENRERVLVADPYVLPPYNSARFKLVV